MRYVFLFVFSLAMAQAQYSTSKATVDGFAVVHLVDKSSATEVSVVPGFGNIAYSMKVKGNELMFSPVKSLGELRTKPSQLGVPFLAPWANRIAGLSYWANGKQYKLNPDLGSLRIGNAGNPIHGTVIYSDAWQVVEAKADSKAAWVRSRLDFWKHPEWMAQFPFAHAIEMTYRLSSGVLEVITEIENLSRDAMPVAVGYHPWFQIPGGRDAWQVHIAAKEHLELNEALTPTGKRNLMKLADPFPLKGGKLDDVFVALDRNSKGVAEFWVTNGKQKLTVSYGKNYPVAVVYAPPGRDLICFEPMAAITDAFNLNHKGLYPELQSVAPGGKWRESFWISVTGF